MDRFEAPCHQSQQRIPTLPQLCTAQHKPRQGLQDPQGYVVMTLLKADSPVDLRLQRLISLTAHTRQVHRLLRLNAQLVAQHRRLLHMQKRIRRNTIGRKHKVM